MSKRGRYGKYGDVKRKEILRRSRLLKVSKGGTSSWEDISREPTRRKPKHKK